LARSTVWIAGMGLVAGERLGEVIKVLAPGLPMEIEATLGG